MLEFAEVEDVPDDREVGVDIRPNVDVGADDFHSCVPAFIAASASVTPARLSRDGVEASARDQDVQLDADQADGLTAARLVHGRITQIRRVDDRDATAADDFELVVRAYEGGRIFVEADTDRKRVVRERREQATEAVALPEMLIDDELVGQAQPRRHRHHIRVRRTALDAARDHVFGHERSAGRRAGHVHAVGIAAPDQLRDVGAAERRRQAQLIAARHEHAIRLVDIVEFAARLAVLARLERQHLGMLDAELAKQLFVVAAGILELARGRNDADTRILAAAELDEAVENFRVVQLFFGAADRDDVAAVSAAYVI